MVGTGDIMNNVTVWLKETYTKLMGKKVNCNVNCQNNGLCIMLASKARFRYLNIVKPRTRRTRNCFYFSTKLAIGSIKWTKLLGHNNNKH